jgi:hypothetical protein
LGAHFGLAFATATPNGLTWPPTITRRPIMQKVRSRAFPEGHSASTACRHTISGSFHSPSRGSFRLSLMVLVHYRSSGSIQPWKMVLPGSHRVARAPWYSGAVRKTCPFRLKGYHLLWPDFPDSSARDRFCNFPGTLPCPLNGPTTPSTQRRQACMCSVWAIPRSLATTNGISFDFCS